MQTGLLDCCLLSWLLPVCYVNRVCVCVCACVRACVYVPWCTSARARVERYTCRSACAGLWWCVDLHVDTRTGGGGGGGFVRGQVRRETSFVSFGVEIFPTKTFCAIWGPSFFVHPPRPSALRDDENAALVQCFVAIRQDGGPMDKESSSTVSHN